MFINSNELSRCHRRANQVAVKIKRGAQLIAETAARTITGGVDQASPVSGEIPLNSFSPGAYTLEVVILDLLKKNTTASRASDFEVIR